jgi:hypothetical protein
VVRVNYDVGAIRPNEIRPTCGIAAVAITLVPTGKNSCRGPARLILDFVRLGGDKNPIRNKLIMTDYYGEDGWYSSIHRERCHM